jgi:formylglycine-generating enzyme required for sulfatase activity/tRNA A-37 threonylcarbamoyl transferase component Bud32
MSATGGCSQLVGSFTDCVPAVVTVPPQADSIPPGLAEHPDFEVISELGRGGMGVVYLATNKLMGRKEVLKVVSRERIDRAGALDRFLREIRNAAQLHHPNIVTAYSAIRVGESIVFAMEYVEGHDLSQLVKLCGPLPVAHACNFIYQAALGLQYAHEQGMVHRDIKPSNLILARHGKEPAVKVLDFGLAKATREGPMDRGLTHEGQMLGTPDFIAPEQSLDAHKADIRADIYSLGCTLYYLLSGGAPFQATSLYELLQAHHSMEAKPLNLVRPEVPWELAAVVAKMMAKEPGRRFQTPGEVAQALTPFFKVAPLPVPAPATSQRDLGAWWTAVGKPSGMKLRVWSAVGGLLVLGLVVAWAAGALRVKTANRRIESRLDAGSAVKTAALQESIRTSIGMTLKLIPPGVFFMGAPDDDTAARIGERPSHRVRISKPFYLGVHEVTQAEYKAVMGHNPSHFAATGGGKAWVAGQSTEQYPVDSISWLDAVRFCNALSDMEAREPFYKIDGKDIQVPDWNGLGYRLPTEAEWEYACRLNAPSHARYSFGDDETELGEFGWFSGNSDLRTHPVGQKKPNGFGLYDMHGNIEEWCWDWFGVNYYSESPVNGPTGPVGAAITRDRGDAACRIFRGGNCLCPPGAVRSASRNWHVPESTGYGLGFRLAVGQSSR